MPEKICKNCHASKPISAFKLRVRDSVGGKAGELTAVCAQCTDKLNAARRKRRQRESQGGDSKHGSVKNLGELSAEAFLDAIAEAEAPYHLRATVDVSLIAPKGEGTLKVRATKVARALGDVQLLYWS